MRLLAAGAAPNQPACQRCATGCGFLPQMQLGTIMAAQPASDAERAAKAALFGRAVEALPGLLALRPAQGLAPVLEALESVRALAAGPNTSHQNLFRWRARLHRTCILVPRSTCCSTLCGLELTRVQGTGWLQP